MPRYAEVSRLVFDLFDTVTPLVEPLSIDEAFLDVTGSERLFGSGSDIAAAIRRDIKAEVHLTASVGVAPNKFLAKLASDLDKPDGLTVITNETIDTILPPLSIGRVWGIGPKTANRLAGLGLKTIADLRRMDAEWFDQHFGSWGQRIRQLIHGIDNRIVERDDEAKSIGHEQTFGTDLVEPEHIREVLLEQAEAVGLRVRRYGRFAGSVQVKIRFGDFQTITRSKTLANPTDATADLYAAAKDLFDTWARDHFQPVRLIGMQASQFTRQAQLDLFTHVKNERQREVDKTLDVIKNRFGKTKIHRGGGSSRED
jgi:DNA polymerase-4